MLSSSDAKWRCMWHMLIWSILLTLASQYLDIMDHITVYIFACFGILILPVVTAIYSNTSGRHGANLIRVAYVVCDPVLACISITPVLLLNHLPVVINQYNCLTLHNDLNVSRECMHNRSQPDNFMGSHGRYVRPGASHSVPTKDELLSKVIFRFVAIQISVAIPILLSLLMGRRTRKMKLNTFVLTFAYWFVTAIEVVDMIETIRIGDIYKDVIFTTEAIISITMIITNSYAIVTLCSFISPRTGRDEKQFGKNFNFIYRIFVGAAGVLFTEIPLLVARFQILVLGASRNLPATFYLWFIKDFLFICLMLFVLMTQKFGKKSVITKLPCTLKFDNIDVVFQPEKRDEYIVSKKRVRFQDPPATTFEEVAKRTVITETQIDALSGKETKKQPSSVLKTSTQFPTNSASPNLNLYSMTGKLTDLSMKKASPNNSISDMGPKLYSSSESSSTSGYSTLDQPSSASTESSSPRLLTGGARPKIHVAPDPKYSPATPKLVKEIKSRPDADNKDSDDDF